MVKVIPLKDVHGPTKKDPTWLYLVDVDTKLIMGLELPFVKEIMTSAITLVEAWDLQEFQDRINAMESGTEILKFYIVEIPHGEDMINAFINDALENIPMIVGTGN